MSPPLVTEAICLTVQKYSETSKIGVLYTRHWGRISIIAKGANRPKSQYLGHLEPLSIAECVIYFKPAERLQLLASIRATSPWLPVTATLARSAHGFAVCELLYRHTLDEPDPDLFQLAVDTLKSLAILDDPQTGRQFWGFMLGALECLGFRPEFEHCVQCGSVPGADQRAVFDSIAGKILCRRCRRDEGRLHVLSPPALQELKTRQRQPILGVNEPPLASAVEEEIAGAIGEFATYHLGGRRLRSLALARRVADLNEPSINPT
jgi:DNA repair protein RecO (recombination protein O)